ncbi:MAG: chaplin family protein, partial [Streptosporangiaceae bacterium]
LTAGFVLPASAAFADGPSGNGNAGVLSLLSGNDVNAPVSAPINVCGVAVALLGGANAGCEGGAVSNTVIGNGGNGGTGGSDNGNAGGAAIGSGNTINAPVSAPVNVCGVSGAVAGVANSGCKGGAASNTVIKGTNGGSHNGNAGIAAIGSGNTVNAPVSVPVNLCGISVALAGFSNASCEGGSFSNTLINP